MKVFCTSKNAGPSYSKADSAIIMLYLGTSEKEAMDSVESFHRYEKPRDKWPANNLNTYSALPATIEREMLAFYTMDGYWCSVVMFDLN